MTRTPNFIYESPAEAIGASLGKALFGDPELAAAQAKARTEAALREAQTAEATAHGRLYGSQATGQDYQDTSAASLPGLVARLTQPQVPFGSVSAPADSENYPDVTVTAPTRANLGGADMGSVIAALAGMKGDSVEVGETVGALSAMLGDDEFARRGLIAQGHTPGKEFAVTSDRADEIAGLENASALAKAIGVASINNRDDIPVANIQAETARRGQDVSASTRRRGQDISSTTARRGQDVRAQGARSSARSGNPITPAAYKMLFGTTDDPSLGELAKQLDIRGWEQTPDAGTLSRIRAEVIDRYQQSGNHFQAVRDVLDEVKRRWDLKQAGRR